MQGRRNQYLEDLKKYNFNEILKKEKNSKIQIRLLALQQVKEGKRITEVAKMGKRIKPGGKNIPKAAAARDKKMIARAHFERIWGHLSCSSSSRLATIIDPSVAGTISNMIPTATVIASVSAITLLKYAIESKVGNGQVRKASPGRLMPR